MTDVAVSLSERDLAHHHVQYLENEPGACLKNRNVHGWSYIRHAAGEWRAVRFAEPHEGRRTCYVHGAILDEDTVLDFIAAKPVSLIPAQAATKPLSDEEVIWETARDQDVFTTQDRCWYCGESETTIGLDRFHTVEDGTIHLCPDCESSWRDAGEIVAEASPSDNEPTPDQ